MKTKPSALSEVRANLRDQVIAAAGAVFFVEPAEVMTRTRREPIATTRRVVMYYLHYTYALPTTEVARLMKRDHGSVVFACRSVINQRATDRRFKARLVAVRERLQLPDAA